MAMPYPAYGAPRSTSNDDHLAGSYPPNGAFNPASSSSTYVSRKGSDDKRNISRTPSPTPSEAKALSEGLFTWKQVLNWRFWFRREWLTYYIILVVILAITALVTIYHEQIVEFLTPVTKWLHDLKFGWLVPIGVLFVISFPPLFGHEIVAILCGLVWGLWIGFGIVCAGTFLGEVGNFYAFKYCCRARGEKMERTQIPYACLARCVRFGGFKIALIARFSAIPGHFTTAVFATCGMNIWVFSIAAILSLPKQLITVYLGVMLEQAEKGTTDTKSRIISDSVLGFTFLITVLAMWWIFRQMGMMKPHVIYERRKARQGKLARADVQLPYSNGGLNDSNSSISALADIPLQHPRYDYEQQQKQRQYQEWEEQQRRMYEPQHQQWDAQGRAVGYTPGPAQNVMYAPQPRTGRAQIQPGAYTEGEAEVYGHGRNRAETSDEVQWDMGPGVQMRDTGMGGAPSRAPQQPQRQNTGQQPQQPQPALYTYQQPPPRDDPNPTSPFDDSAAYAHGVEPTGASYHTAYEDSGSEDSHTHIQPGPEPGTNVRR
ncbi:hypothetical protein C8J57DRAFT_1301983 [Mycena rebaudengoi]|nr:hypothetical protein C8J57DRAFT_1301983 [Mycena rebaudengoi]